MTTTAVRFDVDRTLISSDPPDRVELARTVVACAGGHARTDGVFTDLTRALPL